ncbi:Bis(5'-nucleosyl)-tetraphosphatase PrpE [asymmetrical] [compost metagenome]
MTKYPKVKNVELTQLIWGGESYDFIGDIHGCYNTLIDLLKKLDYSYDDKTECWIHESKRIPVFLGDLVDRGSMSFEVIDLVMKMLNNNLAKYVPGNHCNKLYRYLKGNNVKIGTNLKVTLSQFEIRKTNNEVETNKVLDNFLLYVDNCDYHLILDKGNVIAVHAATDSEHVGVHNRKTKEKNIYGFLNKEKTDEKGRPLRIPTHDIYNGKALVVHGHIANENPIFKNNVLDIDTGCGTKDGKLTAFRYPEGNFVESKVIDHIVES